MKVNDKEMLDIVVMNPPYVTPKPIKEKLYKEFYRLVQGMGRVITVITPEDK